MSYTSQQEQIPGIRSIARTLTGGDAELSIASAGTANIGASLSNRVLITGTTTITSFGSVPNIIRFVRFAGILTLTHNGTSLILPTATNITTAANDIALFTSDASGNWRLISYNKANGQALVGSAGGSVIRQSYTATAGQTTQTVSGSYTPGLIDVYINGSKLVNGDDVIVTSGTSVTFTVPLIVGDAIDIIGSLSAVGSALLSSSIRQSLTPSTEGQTVFTVSGGYAPNALDVYYNGSKLQPVTDVTTSSGSTITLLFPSTLTDVIDVVGVNVLSSIGTVSRQSFVATAGQVDFIISGGYQANSIDVFQNGVKLQNAVDVTVTTGTKVTLITPATLNDIIDVCASQQAGGNGVCNLSTTQDATTVTVVSSTGGSAVLPAATTTTAGILSAADKVSLRNYGMKNRIINGGMQVAQRGGTALVNNVHTYGSVDRMIVAPISFTTATGTISQGVNGNFATQLSTQAVVTTTGSGSMYFGQRIEAVNARSLSAQTCTFSIKVYQETGASLTPFFNFFTPTVSDVFSTVTQIGSNITLAASASGAYTTYTATVTFAYNATMNGLWVSFVWPGIGAITSKNFFWGDFQLELGSQATEFEHRPYGTELALCQRYYETTYDIGVAPGTVNNVGNWQSVVLNPTDYYDFGKATFKVTKRATPTVTAYSTGTGIAGKVRQQGSTDLNSSIQCIGMNGCRFNTSGATVNNFHELHWTASAEL